MKTPKWTRGWALLSLLLCVGCGTTPVRPLTCPPPPGLLALTEPTAIEGPTATRYDAVDNAQLWDFAGQAEAAVARANHDKALARALLAEPPPPPCTGLRRVFGRC